MYGIVEIGGKQYTERAVTIPSQISVTAAGVMTGNEVLPGTAIFWLKGLAREVIAAAAPATNRFTFKLGNSDGNVWYSAAGVGGTTDRVLDSLLFGTGQFPVVINPHILYAPTASIKWELSDISGVFPYTVYIAYIGSWLIPL